MSGARLIIGDTRRVLATRLEVDMARAIGLPVYRYSIGGRRGRVALLSAVAA